MLAALEFPAHGEPASGTPASGPMELLSKEHSILERPVMQFRPFGVTPDGQKIRDVSGITIKANVEYLEEVVGTKNGEAAGRQAIERLCDSLNARISDPSYHVTPEFLQNIWHSYSYEFAVYLGEFCILISEDPNFQFEMGKHKFISPVIQTLGRPFSVAQIFQLFPRFGEKFAKDSLRFSVRTVTNGAAVLGMTLTEHVTQQFGPYRNRCAYVICQASKGGLLAVPQYVHHLGFADVRDLQCMADGDESCEWEFHWPARPLSETHGWAVTGTAAFASLLAFFYIRWVHAELSWLETAIWTIIPGMGSWFAGQGYRLKKKAKEREALLKEQVASVDARHEELREAYLEQERTVVELRTLNADLENRVQERTQSLDAANQKLRELDQRKSAFVSMASHEIRTPLTSMKGFVENMLAGVTGDLRERQVLYLTRVKYNIERLTRTLNDLLDLSRIEAGHVGLRLVDVSLAEVTAEALDSLRPQAEAKSLVLETVAPSQLAPVRGDRDKILQILTNLVHNAIKFTPSSGRISIGLTPVENSAIQVCVADTGCGIAAEEVPRVFDRFYRSDSVTTDTRGAGLGLAITKSLVDLHQGRIWVESTVGSGSRFYFTLPTR